MCNAKPGTRCTPDAFEEYQKARIALRDLPADATGLDRARAQIAHDLAAADYAATCTRENPELAAAAKRVRREQVALMPTKPALGEPGLAEYQALASARDRLASVLTAAWGNEVRGQGGGFSTSQVAYEEALLRVQQAERAFRDVAWGHYDVSAPAQAALADATRSGDPDAIAKARAAFYLSQHRDWPERAEAKYRAAHVTNDEAVLDAANLERAQARQASAAVRQLIDETYPHQLVAREHPGRVMPPAPWVNGPMRATDPSDAVQVRYLCEGGASEVRWSREHSSVTVVRPTGETLNRLWAYGYRTEVDSASGLVRIPIAPDIGGRRGLVRPAAG